LLVAGFIMHRLKLPAGDVDMVPSNHLPEPLVAEPVAHDRGPVLILIEYLSKSITVLLSGMCWTRFPRNVAATVRMVGASPKTQPIRKRWSNGSWRSRWSEHLRQHKRVSNADADLQGKVLGYHTGPEKPGTS
jgi:hypothetical protein